MYQPSSSSTSRRILVVLALALFIVALVLVIVQSFANKQGGSSIIGTYGKGYVDGYTAARQTATTIYPFIEHARTSLSGVITNINGNRIEVQVADVFVNERVDGVGAERVVNVSSDTQILMKSVKDGDTMRAEQNAYDSELSSFDPANGSAPPEPPKPYEEVGMALSDLVVGDSITIYSTDDTDLTFAKTINASKILRQTSAQQSDEAGIESEE